MSLSAFKAARLFYFDKKHGLFESFGQAYADLRAKPYFRIVPFFADDVLDFERDAAVPEMHDRIIAGLARRFGAPLITSDPQIEAANLVEVMW